MTSLGVGFSGFFLRENIWCELSKKFDRFLCFDNYRDQNHSFSNFCSLVKNEILSSYYRNDEITLVGHSAGAAFALGVSAELNKPSIKTVLLSGIGYKQESSISEIAKHYNVNEAKLLINEDLTRLNLSDVADFLSLVEYPLELPYSRVSESLEIVHSPILRPICCKNIIYVAAKDDLSVSYDDQKNICDDIGGELVTIPGGHMAALRNLKWLGDT